MTIFANVFATRKIPLLLILCWVALALPAEAANVAEGKPAQQSTTAFGGSAGRAVDGNTSGNWKTRSVTHTDAQNDPWWEVDLGARHRITKIEVWNRTDMHPERLNQFSVIISRGSNLRGVTFTSPPKTVTARTARSIRIPVGNVEGRYVRVRLNKAFNYLSLAEVRVEGTPVRTAASRPATPPGAATTAPVQQRQNLPSKKPPISAQKAGRPVRPQSQPPAEFRQNTQPIDYSKYDNKKVNFRSENGKYLAANGPFGPVTVANTTSTITQFETYLQGKDLFVRSVHRTYLTAAGNGLQLRAFSGVPNQVWRLIPKTGSNPLRFYLQSTKSKYLAYGQNKQAKLLPFSTQATPAWLISTQASGGGTISSPGAITQPLSALLSSKWPTNSIPVCWENPEPTNAGQRQTVRTAVLNSWEAQSCVNFTGWGPCEEQDDGIRILIEDDGPHTKGLGSDLDGRANGMVLNFTFEEWNEACDDPMNYNACVRSIAIHEFGHGLGFSHEHNRMDCTMVTGDDPYADLRNFCTDAPQGTSGDWNITACDADSIMNYCFGSSYSSRLSALDIDGVRAMYGSCAASGNEEIRTFAPRPIGTLCPSNLESGDREFNGNGPRMRVDVNLRISDDSRELWADIDFFAAEYDPSDPITSTDPTTVKQRFAKKLWSEPGTSIVALESDNISSVVQTTSPPGGFEVACTAPTAGVIPNPIIEGGLVRRIEMIGDTGGNDVSDDSNCDCDTQIKRIEFNSIQLRVRRD